MEHFCEYLVDGKWMFSRQLADMYSAKARFHETLLKSKEAEKEFSDSCRNLEQDIWKHYNEDEIKAAKMELMEGLITKKET